MRLKTVIAAVCGACLACSLAAAPLASAEEAAAPGGSAPVVGEPGEVEPTPPAAESFKGAEFAVGGCWYEITKITSSAIQKGTCEATVHRYDGSGTSARVPATVTYVAGGLGPVKLKVTAIAKDAFNNSKGHKIKTLVIGKNVVSIGEAAFKDCKKLMRITYQGKAIGYKTKYYSDKKRKGQVKVSPIGKSAFKGLPTTCDAYTPTSKNFNKLEYKQGVRSAMIYAGFKGRVL